MSQKSLHTPPSSAATQEAVGAIFISKSSKKHKEMQTGRPPTPSGADVDGDDEDQVKPENPLSVDAYERSS